MTSTPRDTRPITSPLIIPVEHLPVWMRRAQRGVDWGVLLVMAFGLLAGVTFWLGDGLPEFNANRAYAFMTADFAEALREGVLYPRWSPHALRGYGAPIPNFYPPGGPYAAALAEVLLTNNTRTALRLVYALSVWGAGVAAYCFVARWIDARAGALAALLLTFSPYLTLTAPLAIGDLPSVVGMALLTSLLWALSRLLLDNHPFDLGLTALTGAALLLTEPRLAAVGLLLCALLIGLALADTALCARRGGRARLIVRCGLALGLAVALAAPYWLPALLESAYVEWLTPPEALILPPARITFAELLAGPRPLDPAAMTHAPSAAPGLGLIVGALLGGSAPVARALARRSGAAPGSQPLPLAFGALALGVGGALLLANPAPYWLLGPLTLCLAMAAAGAPAAMRAWRVSLMDAWRRSRRGNNARGRWIAALSRVDSLARRLALPVAVIAVLIAALPSWLTPRLGGPITPLTPAAQVQYALDGYGAAVLPAGAAIPSTIPANLEDSRFLLESYREASINRFAPDLVPGDVALGFPGALVENADLPARPEQATHGGRFAVLAQRPTQIIMLLAWFPGWGATLNGRSIPLRRDPSSGLVTLALPATSTWSALTVALGSSDVRAAAWLLAGGALLTGAGWTRVRDRRHRRAGGEWLAEIALLTLAEARLLAVVLLCFAGVIAATALPSSAPLVTRPGPFSGLEGAEALRAQTDGGLEALAYRVERESLRPGETLRITVYWRVPRALDRDIQVRAYLYEVNRRARAYETLPRYPGGVPTRAWIPGAYLADRYEIVLPSDIFPGSYQFSIEAFACADAPGDGCARPLAQRFIAISDPGSPAAAQMTLPGIITVLD